MTNSNCKLAIDAKKPDKTKMQAHEPRLLCICPGERASLKRGAPTSTPWRSLKFTRGDSRRVPLSPPSHWTVGWERNFTRRRGPGGLNMFRPHFGSQIFRTLCNARLHASRSVHYILRWSAWAVDDSRLELSCISHPDSQPEKFSSPCFCFLARGSNECVPFPLVFETKVRLHWQVGRYT